MEIEGGLARGGVLTIGFEPVGEDTSHREGVPLEVGGVGAVNRELIAHSSTTLHLAPTLRRLFQVPRNEEGVRVGGLYKKDLSYFLRRRDSRGLELEIKAVVGLEEETFEGGGMGGVGLVGPITGFELEGPVIGVDGDGGLWNPGERFCKT